MSIGNRRAVFDTASVLALAIGLASAGHAVAQDPRTQGQADADRAEQVDDVIVTGTRTQARTAFDSAVPVDVISGDALRTANGAGDLGDAIEAVVPSFNLPLLSAVGTADNIRAPRLRGLYPDQVLVLINGKRRHHSSVLLNAGNYATGTSPVDFNGIPTNAIARIEVLRDGAGAQYGSDAVAGVINIVLKEGAGDGSITATYGGYRTQFDPTQREISDGETLQLAADYGLEIGDAGFLRIGVSYRDQKPTNRSGFDTIPTFEDSRNRTVPGLLGAVNFASGQGQSEGVSGYFNGSIPVGGAEIYGFGTVSLRDTTGTAFFRYPYGNAGLRDENLTTAVFPNGYLPRTTAQNDDYAVVSGLRSSGDAWDWDLSARFARNDFVFGGENTLNPSLGEASPTAFRTASFRFDQVSLNADAVRRVQVNGFASPLNVAFGAEYRWEDWTSTPGDPASYAAGPVRTNAIGAQGGLVLRPQDAADLDRSVFSAYLDLEAEVTDRFLLGGAVRYENYSDFGDALTGKLAARYSVLSNLNLRGSISTSVRAPTLAQQGFGATDQAFSSTGTLQLVDRRILPISSPVARALGATELDQETSTNTSLGITYRPIAGLTLSVDAYRIEVEDRIQLSQQINSAAVRLFIQNNFGLTNIDRVQYFANINESKTEGFDAVASYMYSLGGGTLNLTAAYNYGRTEFTSQDPLPAALAAIDPNINLFTIAGLTSFDSAPLSRSIFTADWSNDRWSVHGSATRFGRMTRGSSDASRGRRHEWEGDWSVDVEAEYSFDGGVSVAIGANNVFDAYPEQAFAVDNYFGNLPYDFTVPIGYNGAFYYVRAGYAF
jgi:iron complex outermembrane receptor protein